MSEFSLIPVDLQLGTYDIERWTNNTAHAGVVLNSVRFRKMLNSKRLNNIDIILEKNIAQSICPASKFHRKKINSTLALRTHTKKDQISAAMTLTWPAHALTNSSHVLVRYQFTGRDMPLQNSSGVAILVSLQECQECEFFQHITAHRKTTSRKPQVKIRLAFHFVERN